ncbi:MAG: DUF2975 domain-containing protein [Lachnospiraceae bacterium]|nr:DUF2975 domain-containing protein [Lachnospiraceae bacterium]
MDATAKKKNISRLWMLALIYTLVMLTFFAMKDFIKNVRTGSNRYEIRYETEKTLSDEQMIYRLYINDEYVKDVDINKYSYVDENGKTDYKYCALIENANSLTSTLLLAIMFVIVVFIVKDSISSTPFTKKNVNRIRLLSALQISFAVFPGAVSMMVCFFRFNYYSADFTIRSFYPLIIAFITGLISTVFDIGVKLQEDSDSIV